MTALIHLDAWDQPERLLHWALPLGAGGQGELLITWPARQDEQAGTPLDLAGEGSRVLTGLLDERLGPDGWTADPEPDGDGNDGDGSDGDGPITVQAQPVAADDPAAAVLDLLRERDVDRLVMVLPGWDGEDGDAARRRRALMRGAGCEVVIVRAGDVDPERQGLLVGVARGPHARRTLQLASELVDDGHGPATAVTVQPSIGSRQLSRDVGRRVQDRLVQRALGERRERLAPLVVLDEQPHVGLIQASDDQRPGLVLLGSSKAGAVGRRLRGTVWQRLASRGEGPTVAVVRAALPLHGRFLRRVEALLQRVVPQLEREQRLELVERVQSNSHWDFDFCVLICLSTLIAAAGLIQDAPAVVIGAMLVAPLMTPMLGLGLALAQGNTYLVRQALRSVALGAGTAVVLGAIMGLAHPGFVAASAEMAARGGPNTLDLFVAFTAGLAAAYASSRPSLLAALPGVAIAAALVPPLATCGLALALGSWSLAGGAGLLFVVNLVAITLAATLTLWTVGLRNQSVQDGGTKVLRGVVVVSGLLLLLVLARPHGRALPDPLREAWQAALPPGLALTDVRWLEDGHLRLSVRGPSLPPAALGGRLAELARAHLGEPVRLTLQASWASSHGSD